MEPDVFGLYDNGKMVDRGWLTTETVVQFKLFGDPIQLWKLKYEGRKVECIHLILFQSYKPLKLTACLLHYQNIRVPI